MEAAATKPSRAPRRPIEAEGLFTIQQFARRNGLSRSSLYQLWKNGEGPRRLRVGPGGGCVRISSEAEVEWRAARQEEVAA